MDKDKTQVVTKGINVAAPQTVPNSIFVHSMFHSSTTALQRISKFTKSATYQTLPFRSMFDVHRVALKQLVVRSGMYFICMSHKYFIYVFVYLRWETLKAMTTSYRIPIRMSLSLCVELFELLISAFRQLIWPCGRIRLQTFSSRFVTGALQRILKSGEITTASLFAGKHIGMNEKYTLNILEHWIQ